MYLKILLSISLLLTLSFTNAQTIELYGKIVNGSSPLYNITVKNVSKNTGVITDFSGDFSIPASSGDTIQFSSIGYKSSVYTLPDSISSNRYRILVNMIEDTVYLKETVIKPWPANRTMLKQAMLDTKKEKEKVGAFAGFREIEGDPEEPDAKLSNPISFLYDRLSKKARQKRKMEKYRKIIDQNDGYYQSKDDEIIY